jgi:hypothetical protein
MSNKRSGSWLLFAGVALALMALTLAVPTPSLAQFSVGVAIHIAPPALPVYAQPICPGPNYIWTPGYWAYDDVDGYYWVPGTWVLAPEAGLLWTPGYWGWGDGAYVWHAGYWGPHVGFYGGINYGFGYTGVGYEGGYWDHGAFRYNTAVNHVNVNIIHNTYEKPIARGGTANRVSFNGGRGGVNARPTAAEETAARDRHVEATSAQAQHREEASKDHGQFASVNHGRPAVAETAKPGEFGHGTAPERNAGNANRNAGVEANKQAARNVPNNNHSVRANQPPVENSNRSAERSVPANGNARFNAKPESNPRGNFERPAETPRANSEPRPERPAPPAPRESAPARAPQTHAEQPHAAAQPHAVAPHAAAQPHGQVRAGEAPRANERHDGK